MAKKRKQKKVRSPFVPNPNSLSYRLGQVIGRGIIYFVAGIGIIAVFAGILWVLSIFDWVGLLARFRFQFSIEYVQALAWPVVVVVALIVLRGELLALIRRMTKFSGPGGVSADFTPQQKPSGALYISEEPALLASADGAEETKTYNSEIEKLYADPAFQLSLERAYRNIFGTQIELLYLLSGINEGYGEDDLLTYLARHNERRVGDPINFESYVGYLLANNLVLKNSNGIYQITVGGTLFLRYLVDQGLGDPNVKPL